MDTDSGSPLPRLFVDGVILAERFRIVRMLGAGGMGEVYEAEDMVLSRERIALKTLRASFAADEASIERLRKELLLARRITHPNVCRVHDVYEHHTPSSNRVLFFTMELLEGETLADRLSRETLTSTTALPIARQIGAALQAAHLVRVAHGDLKPANIILARSDTTRERVVVTDFGLARALPVGSGVVSASGVSRPWGTPAYMAPEQLLSGIVTRATDIYAFGVILCELVTGQRPFTDGSPMFLALKKMRHAPRLPREDVSTLDSRWQTAIVRCLDADPGKRFAFAPDVVRALEGRSATRYWPLLTAAAIVVTSLAVLTPIKDAVEDAATELWATLTGSAVEERTIAVLPFTPQRRTADDDAYALGLTAAVTEQLGAMSAEGGAYVVPPEQVIDTGVDTPATVRLTLGANLIVTGSIEARGDRTMVMIGVSEASNEGFRETDRRTIDGGARDESVQANTLTAIAQLLNLGVPSINEREWTSARAAAEWGYLLGRGHLLRGVSALPSAISAFEEAIAEDGGYAEAYIGLGNAHLRQYEATGALQSLKDAETIIDRAVDLQPLDARARMVRGRVYLATGQHKRAIVELTHALEIDPNIPLVRNQLAAAYEADGAIEMAEQEYRAAIAFHPRYWSGYEDLGTFLFRRGRYGEAEQNYVTGIEFAPANRRAIANLAAVYEIQERFVAAESELIKGLELSPDAILYNNLGWVYILDGKLEDAVKALQEAVKLPGANSIVWSGLARASRWARRPAEVVRPTYATSLAKADEELRINPLNVEVQANRAYLLAETGRGRDAQEAIAATLASERARGNVTVLFRSALVHEWAGDRKAALEFLERAAGEGYPLSRIARDPDLRQLRTDNRYAGVVHVANQRQKSRFGDAKE